MNRFLRNLAIGLQLAPLSLLGWMGMSLDVQAQRLNDLDISVVLSDNGDARITEVRQMEITSKGTECYIPIGNLKSDNYIRDLVVTD